MQMRVARSSRQTARVLFDALESRTHFAASPTPAEVLTVADRQALLTVWQGSNKNTLKSLLNAGNNAGFDSNLLDYMRNRAASWFWQANAVGSYATFINDRFGGDNVTVTNANAVVSHLFPEQGSGSYSIQEPAGKIDWTAATSSNPEYVPTKNRQAFWMDLAQAYRTTGDAKYVTEMTNELASWASQNPPLASPATWASSPLQWKLLDASQRAENWSWSYMMTLGGSGFSAAANTLMLVKLYQHGDYLYKVNGSGTGYTADNRAISEAKGMMILGRLFPEFVGSENWLADGRGLLFNTMGKNFYSDGAGIEQSPGYNQANIEDLLEMRKLDNLSGYSWPTGKNNFLTSTINTYWQFLSPNGTRPAIGDTYRTSSYGLFLKANLIQGTSQWPEAQTRVRDLWIFGTSAADANMNNPAFPTSLGNRGKTYAMTASGNYILRSGNDSDARQIDFDAGPKGGGHGHYDLFNFELSAYGRSVISDPGPYKYNASADRQYAISTKAHNTININGANTGAIDGEGTGDIKVSQYAVDSDSAQITATHWGYMNQPGRPTVTRSIWYDLNGTAIIVDWVEGSQTNTVQQSFNLPGNADNVSGVQSDGSFFSKWADEGNVWVRPISRPNQSVTRNALTFVSNNSKGDYKDDAYRFTVTQSGTFNVFVTLINAYDGLTRPTQITASMITANPTPGGTIQIQLNKGGTSQTIDFTPTSLQRLASNAATTGNANDIAYDTAGRLHMVYADFSDKNLKYTVRDTNGIWSVPEVIDTPGGVANAGDYLNTSLALNSKGLPSVAYFDGWAGDLKYANFNGNEWNTQVVESAGSTGLYPSLAFSRKDGPVMTYFNRTKGELRMAQPGAVANTWGVTTIDSGTGAGVGRWSQLMLDPNRPDSSKWAIAYEDTANNDVKFAIQGNIGPGVRKNSYTIYTAANLKLAGGYTSLAYFASGDSSRPYYPAIASYDAFNTRTIFASAKDADFSFNNNYVNTKGKGLYNNLFFGGKGGRSATIIYFNKKANSIEKFSGVLDIKTGTFTGGKYTTPGAGGRTMQAAFSSAGVLALTGFDVDTGKMSVVLV